MTSGGSNFNDFPQNQLTKYRAVSPFPLTPISFGETAFPKKDIQGNGIIPRFPSTTSQVGSRKVKKYETWWIQSGSENTDGWATCLEMKVYCKKSRAKRTAKRRDCNVACVLLQISWGMQQWKNCENWPTFVEVMNECRVAQFFWLTV